VSDYPTGAEQPVTRINFIEPDIERRNSLTTLLTTDIQQAVEGIKVVVETAAGALLASKIDGSGNDKPPSPPAT
jgi:hypothetical protein